MSKKILVTGFEGFQGHKNNPSWDMLKCVPDQYGDVEIVKKKIKVTYRDGGGQQVLNHVKELNPDAVICFGLWEGISSFHAEKYGWNRVHTSDDNSGYHPNYFIDGAATAPVGGVPTMDTEAVAGACAPINADVSESAGDYLCNETAYRLGVATAPGGEHEGLPVQFVHVMAYTDTGEYTRGRKIAELTKSTMSIISHIATHELGVSPVEDWEPVVPEADLTPQKETGPIAWWGADKEKNRNAQHFTIATFTKGILGVPDIDEFVESNLNNKNEGKVGAWNRAELPHAFTIMVTEKGQSTPIFQKITAKAYLGDTYYKGKLSLIPWAENGLLNSGKIYHITIDYKDYAGAPKQKVFELDLTGAKFRYTDVTNT